MFLQQAIYLAVVLYLLEIELVHGLMQNQLKLTKCCDSDSIVKFNGATGFIQCPTNGVKAPSSERFIHKTAIPFNVSTTVIGEALETFKGTTSKPTGFPNCSSPAKILTNTDDIWFRINAKNEVQVGLLWPFEPVWITIPEGKYCLQQFTRERNFHSSKDSGAEENVILRDHLLYLCASDVEEYRIYVISRYCVGASDLISVLLYVAIVVIYALLRQIQKVVGMLICTICAACIPFFTIFGMLTIVYAPWLDTETSTACEIWYALARYLQVVLTLANLMSHIDMLLTFWKMTRRVKAMNESLAKLKFYVPFIILVPAVFAIVDQTFARIYRGSPLVKEAQEYAYGRCTPPETKFFDHCLALMLFLTLVVVLINGCVILYLKCRTSNLRKNTPSSTSVSNTKRKKQFVDTAVLFLKLLCGSGLPIIIRFLAFLYIGKKDPMAWYFTAIFCGTQLFTVTYYFVMFGVTKRHRAKLRLLWLGKPIHSISDSGNVSSAVSGRTVPPITT